MEFDYISWLHLKFAQIINELGYNINFKVSDEQQFVKDKYKQPDTLFIVVKQFVGPNSFNVRTAPYQIQVLSEQNQLDEAKEICNKFVAEHNYDVTKNGNTFIKHSYQQPSVMSNFNQIDVGVRSILYIPAVLQMMEDLLFTEYDGEYNTISYEGTKVKILSIGVDYAMTPDTQQLPSSELSVSRKSAATLAVTLNIPLYNNALVKKILSIMNGETAGNTKINLIFGYVWGSGAGNSEIFNKDFILTSAHIEETPDQAPGLRVGLMC